MTRLHIVHSHSDSDTEELQKLWATAYCPEHEHRVAQQTMQHQALFQAHKFKMNFTELSAEQAALLLGTLSLEASDCFVDLGCSAGRLVHAAAQCGVRSAVGVDLSPLRTCSTVKTPELVTAPAVTHSTTILPNGPEKSALAA